jgi:hypothetical protein
MMSIMPTFARDGLTRGRHSRATSTGVVDVVDDLDAGPRFEVLDRRLADVDGLVVDVQDLPGLHGGGVLVARLRSRLRSRSS